MNLATNLFLAYMIHFILTYIKIAISKDERDSHKQTRQKLEKLRQIAVKTQEQQKEFLDLKYPKTPPFKWSIKNVSKFILKLAIMILIFIIARHLWKTYIVFQFSLWQVILIMVILPILINKILKRFNLQQDDILIYFR